MWSSPLLPGWPRQPGISRQTVGAGFCTAARTARLQFQVELHKEADVIRIGVRMRIFLVQSRRNHQKIARRKSKRDGRNWNCACAHLQSQRTRIPLNVNMPSRGSDLLGQTRRKNLGRFLAPIKDNEGMHMIEIELPRESIAALPAKKARFQKMDDS
jgi:hypothetical protein